jgi:hypothetical protein
MQRWGLNWGLAMIGAIAALSVHPSIAQEVAPEISRQFGHGTAQFQPERRSSPGSSQGNLEQRDLEQRDLEFSCRQENQRFVLLVRMPTDTLPLLQWPLLATTELGADDPCWQASQRLQQAYEDDEVNYITLGRVEGQFVVCLVGDRRSGCNRQNVLLTIPPLAVSREPTTEGMMSQLFELDFTDAQPSRCDIDDSVYVNLRDYLDRDRGQSSELSCRCYCGFCVCPQ